MMMHDVKKIKVPPSQVSPRLLTRSAATGDNITSRVVILDLLLLPLPLVLAGAAGAAADLLCR